MFSQVSIHDATNRSVISEYMIKLTCILGQYYISLPKFHLRKLFNLFHKCDHSIYL